jgi:NADH-quinone oxidoreductase subunit M
MPVYAAVLLAMTMSSIGLPTLNGFIGEFLILQGVFVASKVWAAFAASGVVLGAAYMLYLYQRTMFGKIENPKKEGLLDLSHREFATFAPLIPAVGWDSIRALPAGSKPRAASSSGSTRSMRGYCRESTRRRRAIAASSIRAAKFLDALPCGT